MSIGPEPPFSPDTPADRLLSLAAQLEESNRDDTPSAQRGAQASGFEQVAIAAAQLVEAMRERDDRQSAVDAAAQHVMESLVQAHIASEHSNRAYQRVESMLRGAVGSDELVFLAALLEASAQKPSDLLVLVKLSEQAATLATIVRTFSDVRQLLDEEPGPDSNTP